jgi:hypothetical protein
MSNYINESLIDSTMKTMRERYAAGSRFSLLSGSGGYGTENHSLGATHIYLFT